MDKKIELFAWLGEDEFGSGEIGLKQALVPAGYIPLVAVKREKVDRDAVAGQLQQQVNEYRKPISLGRFELTEVVKTLNPQD